MDGVLHIDSKAYFDMKNLSKGWAGINESELKQACFFCGLKEVFFINFETTFT